MDNVKQQNVVFEEIFNVHRWIIKWYLFRKKQVFFLRLNIGARQRKWVQDYCMSGKITQLDLDFKTVGIYESMYFDAAFDNLDKIFDQVRDKVTVTMMKKLYQTESIEQAYKIGIHKKLARFYYLVYVMNHVQLLYPNNRLLFIPTNGIDVYRTQKCEINEFNMFYKMTQAAELCTVDRSQTEFALWATWISRFFYGVQMMRAFVLILIFSFGSIVKALWNFIRKGFSSEAKQYTYAFNVFPTLHHIDNRIPKFDLLIDEDKIKKKESVFVSYAKLNEGIRTYLDESGMHYIDDLNGFIHIKDVLKIIPALGALLFSFLRESYFLSLTNLKLLHFYLWWSGFSRQIHVSKLVCFCDFGIESLARNILLEKGGTQTYYYMDSSNFGCLYSNDNAKNKYRSVIGYSIYDYFISWNDQVSNYFKESKCQFKHYVNVGCLWSESVRLIGEGKISSNFKQELCQNGFQDHMKVISIFDSTFHDDSITTYTQGVQFFKDVLQLLDEDTNIFIVIKEKKSRMHHKRIASSSDEVMGLYRQMDEHRRVLCIKNLFTPSEMIAYSDLTISFPFTSPSIEALSARKKALWHDATNSFCGVLYDQVPGMVTHGYDEFTKRVHQLLYSTSQDEYDHYLEVHVKEKIESYLDGKAITRFKHCLVNGISDARKEREPIFVN